MSMVPSGWTITCSAFECSHERFSGQLSQPLVVQGSRAEAVTAARAAGWVPTADLIGSSRASTASWWCPAHVARSRAAVVDVEDPERRRVLTGMYEAADRARVAASRRLRRRELVSR